MRVTASRRDGGRQLREAMKEAGHNRLSLAARTKELDDAGHGVSQQLIAFLSTTRRWGRDSCSPRSAALIAMGLNIEPRDLFVMPEVSTYN